MNNKVLQFWRFVVLNLKILKGVDASKRARSAAAGASRSRGCYHGASRS